MAQLFIKEYYASGNLPILIKQAILYLAQQQLNKDNAADFTHVLMPNSFATQLFKFGVLCYDQATFLAFLKKETERGEIPFFDGISGPMRTRFFNAIDQA